MLQYPSVANRCPSYKNMKRHMYVTGYMCLFYCIHDTGVIGKWEPDILW